MADELGLLKQLGTQLPPRKDGQSIVPPVTDAGEDGNVVVKRLMAKPPVTQQDRKKVKVARSKSSFAQKKDRANFVQRRWGLQHMRDYGEENGVVQFDPSHAFPGRNDRITGLLAEGDKVWMKFKIELGPSTVLTSLLCAKKLLVTRTPDAWPMTHDAKSIRVL